MPLPDSAVRSTGRKDEDSPLSSWNGGTEDTSSGDHLDAEEGDVH